MDTSRKVSATQFVAYFKDRADVKKRSAKIPGCKELRPLEHDESVQLVRIAGGKKDPREAWKALQAAMPEAIIAPVMIDRQGNTLYSTGKIQIRFSKLPADDTLKSLASHHQLVDVFRNRYQPKQVSCQSANPARRYLPDLIDELIKWPGVTAAWAETRTRYERI